MCHLILSLSSSFLVSILAPQGIERSIIGRLWEGFDGDLHFLFTPPFDRRRNESSSNFQTWNGRDVAFGRLNHLDSLSSQRCGWFGGWCVVVRRVEEERKEGDE
ncbi:hypothetical protein BC567DRAFT_7526 [Phyllosticta citribraziliensis]